MNLNASNYFDWQNMIKLAELDPEAESKRIRGLEGFEIIPNIQDILIIDSVGIIQILGFRHTKAVGSYTNGVFIISETKSHINECNVLRVFNGYLHIISFTKR